MSVGQNALANEPSRFCIGGDGKEVQVTGTGKPAATPPAQYTDCHNHGSTLYCVSPDGDEVRILAADAPSPPAGHDEHDPEELNCHFHAGVEHCVSKDGSDEPKVSCDRVDRDYNVPYRIGSLFAILVTSGIGVFLPIVWRRFSPSKTNAAVFLILKQFGTGIMVATAFVHLLTHAQLMFANKCLGTLKYEATTTAIMMAGLFTTFMMEYVGTRVIDARNRSGSDTEGSISSSTAQTGQKDEPGVCAMGPEASHQHFAPNDKLSVALLEAGIVFHSVSK
ncbi:predicted protein [Uncinocarpus reesii 1704]|uniref:Uncharacterized protein n=1 Tax=Uncinocarpus reesii (strain UAMH 1704) TaxID=336963 RepID=C4JGA5_UNCRE|nr:uncharacterized protein UREG_02503 [Uncinocarpus reesii 1704]EEP77654.1 predicted protein [Uncinocarpus reesii 1704]